MTLKEVCELADACGLETVGEAVLNVELHWSMLFTVDSMNEELNELYEDINELGPGWESMSIFDAMRKAGNVDGSV